MLAQNFEIERIGPPVGVGSAAGLLQVAASGDVATGMLGGRGIEPSGYLRRVGSWLKEF